MSYGSTNAKPRHAGRGFAQSTWRLVASLIYRIYDGYTRFFTKEQIRHYVANAPSLAQQGKPCD